MELTTLLERMKMEHLLAQFDGVCEHAAKGDLDCAPETNAAGGPGDRVTSSGTAPTMTPWPPRCQAGTAAMEALRAALALSQPTSDSRGALEAELDRRRGCGPSEAGPRNHERRGVSGRRSR